MNYIRFVIFGSAITTLLSGCYSTSILQTARTTETGKLDAKFALSGHGSGFGQGGLLPELMLRTGITRSTDLGIFYSINTEGGHFKTDVKQNIFNNKNTFLSAGIGYEYFSLDNGYQSSAINIPIYFSTNHRKSIVYYTSQKFTYSFKNRGIYDMWTENLHNKEVRMTHSNFYSGGIGVMFKKSRKIWLELSYAIHFFRRLEHFEYTGNSFPPNTWGTWKEKYNEGNLQLTIGLNINK